MKVIDKPVSEIKPYAKNPRINDGAVKAVAESIREYGFKQPIVIDKDGVIVAGHTRLKAALMLGLDTVPVIVADDLTPEQVRAFRLVDNKTSELSVWDDELLAEELKALADLDLSVYGFETLGIVDRATDNPYANKIEIPKYEPKEETSPELYELYDCAKTDDLIREIDNSQIPDDVKEFLRLAAYRHTVFNYSRIAEYYCHADKDVQELMEKSALVIIDYDKAIEYGYTTLKTELDRLMQADRDDSDINS